QLQGGWYPLAYGRHDVTTQEEGPAEVAPQYVAEPVDELYWQRLIESEALLYRDDLVLGGLGAEEGSSRIAWSQPDQNERQHRRDQHGRDGGDQTLESVSEQVLPILRALGVDGERHRASVL